VSETSDESSQAWARRRRYVVRAWRGRCPQCGTGPIFQGFAKVRDECPECALVYRREPGAMTGSMYLSAIVTEIFAAGLAVGIFLLTDWGVGLSLAISLPLFLGFSFWFLPRAMGLWTAVEYMVDESHGEPWVDPRV